MATWETVCRRRRFAELLRKLLISEPFRALDPTDGRSRRVAADGG